MSFVFDIAAAQQQSALGKYNQQVYNRNALVKEQEAEAIKKQTEFDIAKFDQQFEQLTGQTKVATLKSGVELSGSALNILRYNAEQAEVQKDVMEYNSQVSQARKIEEANFARISGTIARRRGDIAALGSYARAGESLLRIGQATGKIPQF
jgi:hypothetical protein|tara:strand:+ start:44 stop:496 length:453 start_codon:yes stop_codon:yes gene_type:complete